MNKLQVLLVIFVFSVMSLGFLSNCVLAANLTNQDVGTDTTSQDFVQRIIQKSKEIKNQSDQFSQVANMLTDAQSGSAANQQRIQDTLNRAYQDRLNMIRAQDPEYQGEVLTPANPYNIDIDRLRMIQAGDAASAAYRQAAGMAPSQFNQAQLLQQQALDMYRQQLANQAGVPYEEYLCNGDYVCIQRFQAQKQYVDAMNNYSNALQNQRIKLDANINYQGNVNHRFYY